MGGSTTQRRPAGFDGRVPAEPTPLGLPERNIENLVSYMAMSTFGSKGRFQTAEKCQLPLTLQRLQTAFQAVAPQPRCHVASFWNADGTAHAGDACAPKSAPG
jgi:hypothetical protein